MRAVVTRVTSAAVEVDGEVVGAIGPGLLVLVGVSHDDTPATAAALAHKIAGLRILRDERALTDVDHPEALVVSQFTLLADTRRGRRPSWSAAAPGPVAAPLVETVVETLVELGITVQKGRFGADMAVSSVNDGPVTLVLDVPPTSRPGLAAD
ncbi:D-aminoacyl-tRNA deacylase [Jatrophihabitans sp. YIM 134969]